MQPTSLMNLAPAAKDLVDCWPPSTITPLLDLPSLAARCGVAKVLVKDESKRVLGNFKSLGGLSAGLKALARAVHIDTVGELLARGGRGLPPLICASAGNHGLAVAAAARLAGTRANVYLPAQVPDSHVARIAEQDAVIIRMSGTYDDAVDMAEQSAKRGEGILIADTSARIDDVVVKDVIEGYQTIAREIVQQLEEARAGPPSHLFVQAGVGGLAAALAAGLCHHLTGAPWLVIVEPRSAASVAAALAAGKPVRVGGSLKSDAGMLACGEASAAAIDELSKHGAIAVTVDEDQLRHAVETMSEFGGPASTASGAAGLAGLLQASPGSAFAKELGIDASSSVLVIATERAN